MKFVSTTCTVRAWSVESRWRVVSWFDGTPGAVKAACPVWSGGKGGDDFKALPIAIVFIHEDAERGGNFTDRRAEKLGHVHEVPVSG